MEDSEVGMNDCSWAGLLDLELGLDESTRELNRIDEDKKVNWFHADVDYTKAWSSWEGKRLLIKEVSKTIDKRDRHLEKSNYKLSDPAAHFAVSIIGYCAVTNLSMLIPCGTTTLYFMFSKVIDRRQQKLIVIDDFSHLFRGFKAIYLSSLTSLVIWIVCI